MNRLIATVGVIAVVIASGSLAPADPTFLGSQFSINAYTTLNQSKPRVCARPDNSFVVAWEDDGDFLTDGRDGNASGLFGRLVGPAGPLGNDDFAVNTYTTGDQISARLACTADGGFVVGWSDYYGLTGGRLGAFARRFNPAGTPAGDPFDFNTLEFDMFVRTEAVCSLPSGGFVAVTDLPLRAQRFSADATPIGDPVYPGAQPFKHDARCCGSDTGFVVVWSGYGYEYLGGEHSEILGQRYDNDGQSVEPHFIVNSYTTGYQTRPEIACNDAGEFAVAWESSDRFTGSGSQDGSRSAVVVQKFDADGNPRGPERVANTRTYGYQEAAGVAMREDGEFLVVWSTPITDHLRAIGGRAFGADGTPSDPEEFIVDEGPSNGDYPHVAVNGADGFLVVWEAFDGDDETDIFARRLVLDGNSVTTTTLGSGQGCGDPIVDGGVSTPTLVTASDALFILNAAVGLASCLECVCNVNNAGGITATDALLTLQAAVGQPVVLSCPPC